MTDRHKVSGNPLHRQIEPLDERNIFHIGRIVVAPADWKSLLAVEDQHEPLHFG